MLITQNGEAVGRRVHDDPSNAARKVLRNMVDFLVSAKGLSRDDAYMLIGVAGDVEVTELADRNKGVHGGVQGSVHGKIAHGVSEHARDRPVNRAIAAIVAAACASSAPALAAPSIADCPNDRGTVSVVEVQTELARRSVDIVVRSLAADDATLERLVAPMASFTLWEGDNGWGPRDGRKGREVLTGVAAAREFARHLAASSFEFTISSAGPIATDPCGRQSVTVTFSDATGSRGYVVRFDYLAGRLIKAEGDLANLTHGTIGVVR